MSKDQRDDCRILVSFLRRAQKERKITVEGTTSLSCKPNAEMAIRELILSLPFGPLEKNFPPTNEALEKVLQKAEAFLAIFDKKDRVVPKFEGPTV